MIKSFPVRITGDEALCSRSHYMNHGLGKCTLNVVSHEPGLEKHVEIMVHVRIAGGTHVVMIHPV